MENEKCNCGKNAGFHKPQDNCPKPRPLTDKEMLKIAVNLLERYYELCRELDTKDVMTSSDLIMYEDDFQRLYNDEVWEEDKAEVIKNLRLFTQKV